MKDEKINSEVKAIIPKENNPKTINYGINKERLRHYIEQQ